jgi:separase
LAYHNDYPTIRSRLLDRQAEHPAVEKLSKDDLRQWPSIGLDLALPQETGMMDRADFQENYIDIIPELWTVVSMSLTEDKAAMKLIRYRSGQSPFCLRIPFAYRESDDPDEAVLDMQFAYQRLRSIIKQHEFSPGESRNTSQADFKKQWWQKKHELDAELHSLLSDVEDQWFSAVKAVFASGQCDGQALSNFRAQLQSILCLHCPTKKSKGKAKSSLESLDLEPRILELFVGLGDPDCEIEVEGEDGFVTIPLAESPALSDGIHELVRLVLEGLQFAGESIAIDEVDMDNVIVKVIDALRVYHGAGITTANDASHTVLILDNQLHGFPWESLPCLRHKSVSRLSSLADLRDRIVNAHLGCQDGKAISKTISRTSGVSLLNPSGDLVKTAQRFEPWLPKLPPSWAHLRQAPDDAGWRDLLSENELFLYVGHGSTGQYVRPRIVKRLGYSERSERGKSTCAVAWLIGCGSVAVEDLGEFEPSGMVLNYLAAGSPAVLGALWDVGDIDADHFSITAADYWGLWDESNKGLDPKSFPRRKRILEEKRALGRNMSMCEAVARSRDGCKLPYLNGAAFVVYGIPVFLV